MICHFINYIFCIMLCLFKISLPLCTQKEENWKYCALVTFSVLDLSLETCYECKITDCKNNTSNISCISNDNTYKVGKNVTLYRIKIFMYYTKIPQYHFISLDVCCPSRPFIQHVTCTVLKVMTATYNIDPTHIHYHMFDCCHLNVML